MTYVEPDEGGSAHWPVWSDRDPAWQRGRIYTSSYGVRVDWNHVAERIVEPVGRTLCTGRSTPAEERSAAASGAERAKELPTINTTPQASALLTSARSVRYRVRRPWLTSEDHPLSAL